MRKKLDIRKFRGYRGVPEDMKCWKMGHSKNSGVYGNSEFSCYPGQRGHSKIRKFRGYRGALEDMKSRKNLYSRNLGVYGNSEFSCYPGKARHSKI